LEFYIATLEGQVEHKLPFLFIIAPKWWLAKYPEAGTSFSSQKHHTLCVDLFLLNVMFS